MNKKTTIPISEKLIFRQWLGKTRKIIQDKIFPKKIVKRANHILKRKQSEESAHSYYFSCRNVSHLLIDNSILVDAPVCYIRKNVHMNELKKLKLGKYIPEIFLDLHGLTQNQAKIELGKLFFMCQQEKFSCACIIHGHGKNILKQQIPFWLLQHPLIKAFHSAPKRFGSSAAIFILMDVHLK
ncbi:UPF0115 protein YfcN [Buchnera aphidicola (Eriosoma lanigerum)]|uniref:endonuclease SmrB n=1 Tax=Buchnera aphidicola TaxID=9 RepID=UPI003464AB76